MVGSHVAMNRKAMAIVAEFGRGNFQAHLEPLPGKKRYMNETIDQVRQNLRGLIAEMNRISGEHEAGDIDAVIDVSQFDGDYRTMAAGINTMVGSHVAMNRQAMAVVAEFGKGNFEAPLAELPGKKRFINETVEQVRANLRALIADADLLAHAAVEGRLGVRADATRHHGDFRRIVQGVNNTLEAMTAPVREMAAVLGRLAAGDLSARTDPSRHQNDARAVLEGINTTLGQLLAPIEEATEVLGQLAERDLKARMRGEYQGDYARLKTVLNSTADALHDALAQVAAVVEQVNSASSQIAVSSQAVASGASEQASAIEETSASLESMSAKTTQSVDSAKEASRLANAARSAAVEGTTATTQMSEAMRRIQASAERTAQIIKDINDIAFQTNLLALNAAVEAARAGDAGRGFAVVAEEVRSLALRSKEAATKTEELIRQSVKESTEGEGSSRHVSEKLAAIADVVEKVTAIMGEITAGAREQATGIEHVSTAVSQMDKVTQQNAASAEESSSAATELSGQAKDLAALVGSFRIETDALLGQPVWRARLSAAAAEGAASHPLLTGSRGPQRGDRKAR
jgi:methyl-accepting chemotaxis protein